MRFCIVPHVAGVGGMVSFKAKLVAGLQRRGYQLCFNLEEAIQNENRSCDAILVIGGTRQLGRLWQACRKGIPIIQRLDGMNWLHRLPPGSDGQRHSLRHILRAEYGNLILSFVRRRLADAVIYQSQFVLNWWERAYGATPAKPHTIYNGVDLETYSPLGVQQRPSDRWRVLIVEGSLMGGYEQGISVAVQLAGNLQQRLGETSFANVTKIELMVVGKVSDTIRSRWEKQATIPLLSVGQVNTDQIPEIDRSAHLLYSSDINAACPNSVIEALACGLPVLALATGALPELVTGDAGRVTPYGGDPWRLDPPDVGTLASAGLEILQQQEHFRQAARLRAEQSFGLEDMVDQYIDVLTTGV